MKYKKIALALLAVCIISLARYGFHKYGEYNKYKEDTFQTGEGLGVTVLTRPNLKHSPKKNVETWKLAVAVPKKDRGSLLCRLEVREEGKTPKPVGSWFSTDALGPRMQVTVSLLPMKGTFHTATILKAVMNTRKGPGLDLFFNNPFKDHYTGPYLPDRIEENWGSFVLMIGCRDYHANNRVRPGVYLVCSFKAQAPLLDEALRAWKSEHDYAKAEQLFGRLQAMEHKEFPGADAIDTCSDEWGDMAMEQGKEREAFTHYQAMLRNPRMSAFGRRTTKRLMTYARLAEKFHEPQEAAAAYHELVEQAERPDEFPPRSVPPLTGVSVSQMRAKAEGTHTSVLLSIFDRWANQANRTERN